MKMNRTKASFAIAALYTICVYGFMAAMSIAAAIVMIFWLFPTPRFRERLIEDLKTIRRSPMFWPSMVFAFAMFWSLVWASISGISFYGISPDVHWLSDNSKLWHLFFPFILAAVFSRLSDSQFEKIALLWIGAGVASGALGIVQHYVPLYRPMAIPEFQGAYFHATGLAGFHLSFAAILAFPTAVCFVLAVTKRSVPTIVAAAIMVFCNIFIYSKIAWVALPLMALVVAALSLKGRKRIVLATCVVLLGAAWMSSSEVRTRFAGVGTIQERLHIWTANGELFKLSPLFGVGWQQNGRLATGYYKAHPAAANGFETHAHNNVIEQAATTGLLGLGAFLWWSLAAFLLALKIYRDTTLPPLWRTLALGFAAGWIGLQFNGLSQANFWDAKVLHQIAWVLAMTMEGYRRSAK